MSYRLFFISIIGIYLTRAGVAFAEGPTATQVVDQLQAGIISIDTRFRAEPGDSNDFAGRAAAFTPLITSTHDLAAMARLTIKAHWNNLTDEQRAEFISAFADLSIATYSARFRDLSHIRFRHRNERALPRDRAEVQTELVEADGTIVALNYLLHEAADGWRIINVLADGVSDLALKRTQYQRVLTTQDFAALLRYIREQRDDLLLGDS